MEENKQEPKYVPKPAVESQQQLDAENEDEPESLEVSDMPNELDEADQMGVVLPQKVDENDENDFEVAEDEDAGDQRENVGGRSKTSKMYSGAKRAKKIYSKAAKNKMKKEVVSMASKSLLSNPYVWIGIGVVLLIFLIVVLVYQLTSGS